MQPAARLRARRWQAPGALAALTLAGGCGGSAVPAAPVENLLLVTLDSTRADRLGCYGAEGAQTPTVDALARSGGTFETCIAPSPMTLPSHASLLTGLYPFRHGARDNGTHYLPDGVTTLAERLAARGFDTGAVVSAYVLSARFGLDQGFEHYDDDLSGGRPAPVVLVGQTAADDTLRRALAWLEGRSERPWFLWVHFYDPHAGYAPPEPFATRFAASPYDGEIAFADSRLGLLLERLRARGELERTLVVVTADHGESLGEHGESTHGIFVYDATTRVPLVFAHPSLVQGKRIDAVVSSVDVLPTCLELLGVEGAEVGDGRSLARALRDPEARPSSEPAYSESMSPCYDHGWSDLRAVRDAHGRYVRAPRPELYELDHDPLETIDVAATRPDEARTYRAVLEAFLAQPEVDARTAEGLDPEARGILAALGYVWTTDGATGASGLADPKDRIQFWERTQRAGEWVREGRTEQAEAALRELVADDPGSIHARATLAGVLTMTGREVEAAEELRAAVALPGATARTFVSLAILERGLGDERWREHLARAQDVAPRAAEPWLWRGRFAAESGDAEGALAAFAAALERDERLVEAWVGSAEVERRRGRTPEARAALERALAIDPGDALALRTLGAVAEDEGRDDEALEHYRRAVEHAPEDVRARVSVANLELRRRALGPAAEAYRAALALRPDDFAASFGLGVAELQGGRPEPAREAFERACAADPTSREAWRSLMMASGMVGDDEGVVRAAGRLVALDPTDVRARLAAARAQLGLGREDDARRSLAAALDQDAGAARALATRDPVLARLLAAVEGAPR